MKYFLILACCLCGVTACCPIYTRFQLTGNTEIRATGAPAVIHLSAGDAHYPGSNFFTVFFNLTNTTTDTLYIRQLPPFTVRTQNFDLTASTSAITYPVITPTDTTAMVAIAPADSIKAYYTYKNNFRGGYPRFRKMLSAARIWISPQFIFRNGQALQFEEQEFVVANGQ